MKTKFGEISNGVYYKTVYPEHFMVKFHGFGISVSELNIMKENNVDTIIIIYDGKNYKKVYKSKLEDWFSSSKEWTFEEIDLQKFLSESEMELISEINKINPIEVEEVRNE